MALYMLVSILPLSYIPSPWLFETGSHCIAQTGLELCAVQAGLKLEILCLCFLTGRITACRHAQFSIDFVSSTLAQHSY
jgi:hypothetical protein